MSKVSCIEGEGVGELVEKEVGVVAEMGSGPRPGTSSEGDGDGEIGVETEMCTGSRAPTPAEVDGDGERGVVTEMGTGSRAPTPTKVDGDGEGMTSEATGARARTLTPAEVDGDGEVGVETDSEMSGAMTQTQTEGDDNDFDGKLTRVIENVIAKINSGTLDVTIKEEDKGLNIRPYFCCPNCEHVFSSDSQLNRHLAPPNPRGTGPVKEIGTECPFCAKELYASKCVKTHMKMEHPDTRKPTKKPAGKEKVEAEKTDVQEHEQEADADEGTSEPEDDNDEDFYRCGYCDIKYDRASELFIHWGLGPYKKRDWEIEWLKCSICKKRVFASEECLQEHEKNCISPYKRKRTEVKPKEKWYEDEEPLDLRVVRKIDNPVMPPKAEEGKMPKDDQLGEGKKKCEEVEEDKQEEMETEMEKEKDKKEETEEEMKQGDKHEEKEDGMEKEELEEDKQDEMQKEMEKDKQEEMEKDQQEEMEQDKQEEIEKDKQEEMEQDKMEELQQDKQDESDAWWEDSGEEIDESEVRLRISNWLEDSADYLFL